jgi:anti-anti-sigma factor
MMHSRDPSPESLHTPDFEMHERLDDHGAVRLSLSGELDLAVADRLRSRLQQLARARATIILDLSDLQFIDSTGLQILITNFNEATHDGWQLRIDPNLTRPVRRVVELVGIDHILWPSAPDTSHPGQQRRDPPTARPTLRARICR